MAQLWRREAQGLCHSLVSSAPPQIHQKSFPTEIVFRGLSPSGQEKHLASWRRTRVGLSLSVPSGCGCLVGGSRPVWFRLTRGLVSAG